MLSNQESGTLSSYTPHVPRPSMTGCLFLPSCVFSSVVHFLSHIIFFSPNSLFRVGKLTVGPFSPRFILFYHKKVSACMRVCFVDIKFGCGAQRAKEGEGENYTRGLSCSDR